MSYIDDSIVLDRMSKDIKTAAVNMPINEARYVIKHYYDHQDQRIMHDARYREHSKLGEPASLISWLGKTESLVESQLKVALDKFTSAHPIGSWIKSLYGFGPVLSAAFIAFLDITRSPTAGHVWSYAGLNPNQRWVSAEEARKWVAENGVDVAKAAEHFNRGLTSMQRAATTDFKGNEVKLTAKSLASAIAKRPWNAELKRVAWLASECMVKFSNVEECFYGGVYKKRLAYEWERNLAGLYKDQADKGNDYYDDKTESIKWTKGCFKASDVKKYMDAKQSLAAASVKSICGEPGSGTQMLPPSHIKARAQRYAVKMFLSHLHQVMYEKHYGQPAPIPYILTKEDHVHYIAPPNYTPLRRADKLQPSIDAQLYFGPKD